MQTQIMKTKSVVLVIRLVVPHINDAVQSFSDVWVDVTLKHNSKQENL